MCKVSVIMPVYNKEKYVKRAIESVLQQTLKEWELLIIDDGSTDTSYEVCKTFQDERIRVIRVNNGGVSKARNIGLEIAQGEYVTFLDSDDYLAKDYLEVLYQPNEEMVLSGLTKVSLSYEILEELFPKLQGEKTVKELAEIFYQEQITSGIYGYVSGKMVRREIIERKKIRFNENIRLAEDYDFFLEIYRNIEKIMFLRNTGYYYVQETENSGIALDDSKIDFFTQIAIQKKTKMFLEEQRYFGEKDKKIYLERVTGYVYTILIMNQEINYTTFVLLYKKLKEYVPNVSHSMSGLAKWYISFYDKNWKVLLYILMKIRKLVRKACQK